ncbi:uncharacterized protein A4U43_C03F17760 [Asparagus officinalis]|uniref:Bifunctional inhibitor/plant lipid transfer protein/seed storage helical domain-containing protein n=1 Tax=Asparagus officinalis TaxID=4686 RepID=A0A5P1FFW3_ASPOF|nr:uncharacterized protein A4U43_C03F17760 [Asparagus officinalis]
MAAFAGKRACWALALLSIACGLSVIPLLRRAEGQAAAAEQPAPTVCRLLLALRGAWLIAWGSSRKRESNRGATGAVLARGLKRFGEGGSCLCQAFKGLGCGRLTTGLSLNTPKALALPSACGVRTLLYSKMSQ